MSIEITQQMVRTFRSVALTSGYGIEAGLAAVLDLPEVRQAIHEDVRREIHVNECSACGTGYSLEGI